MLSTTRRLAASVPDVTLKTSWPFCPPAPGLWATSAPAKAASATGRGQRTATVYAATPDVTIRASGDRPSPVSTAAATVVTANTACGARRRAANGSVPSVTRITVAGSGGAGPDAAARGRSAFNIAITNAATATVTSTRGHWPRSGDGEAAAAADRAASRNYPRPDSNPRPARHIRPR